MDWSHQEQQVDPFLLNQEFECNCDPTIESMQGLATTQEGVCLSTTCTTWNGTLQWRCAKGHKFEATPTNILLGYWCIRCAP